MPQQEKQKLEKKENQIAGGQKILLMLKEIEGHLWLWIQPKGPLMLKETE